MPEPRGSIHRNGRQAIGSRHGPQRADAAGQYLPGPGARRPVRTAGVPPGTDADHWGTPSAAITYLADRGADDVTATCLLAAPEGLDTVRRTVGSGGSVTIVVAGVDERLDARGCILPGPRDAGNRPIRNRITRDMMPVRDHNK
jgi:hypothetical protein